MSNTNHDACEALLLKTLRAERKKAEIKQSHLNRVLGKHRSYMSKIETGERHMSIKEFFEIAEVVGFDPHEMLKKVWR